jgi:hypothetical protein
MPHHVCHHQYNDRRLSLFLVLVSIFLLQNHRSLKEWTYVEPQLNRLFGLAGSTPIALRGLSYFSTFSVSAGFVAWFVALWVA